MIPRVLFGVTASKVRVTSNETHQDEPSIVRRYSLQDPCNVGRDAEYRREYARSCTRFGVDPRRRCFHSMEGLASGGVHLEVNISPEGHSLWCAFYSPGVFTLGCRHLTTAPDSGVLFNLRGYTPLGSRSPGGRSLVLGCGAVPPLWRWYPPSGGYPTQHRSGTAPRTLVAGRCRATPPNAPHNASTP